MTLMEHLEELRTRLFICLIAWVIATITAFIFIDNLIAWLQAPLPEGTPLGAFKVLEPFLASMQIAAFTGFVLSAPIIGWQVWKFIAPGLYKEEKRWAIPFVLGTTVSFILGTLFARYIVLPFALPILLGFLGSQVELFISIGNYFSTMLLYMAVFGILFEMPILSFLLARLGILYATFLRRYRRYAIIFGAVLAAFITPTADPFNFALVAVPLVILYEISIFVVSLAQKRVPIGNKHVLP